VAQLTYSTWLKPVMNWNKTHLHISSRLLTMEPTIFHGAFIFHV